ncbi:MAG TPA: fasciclin domain-containing protein [Crocinitomix sp.]|nr:fasciclin domain-containing protein [Crocinitomix sp.]
MKKVSISLLVLAGMFFVSCGGENTEGQEQSSTGTSAENVVTEEVSSNNHGQSGVVDEESDMNALQLALSDERFATLCTAVTETHIEDVLVNAGPLTVFAPLNSGFDKLPEGTLDKLLEPEDKSELAGILKNHVAPANYPVKQLKKEAKKGRKLYMASGNYVEVTRDGDKVLVGGFPILESHKVSNGWVHVIDNVILPE